MFIQENTIYQMSKYFNINGYKIILKYLEIIQSELLCSILKIKKHDSQWMKNYQKKR